MPSIHPSQDEDPFYSICDNREDLRAILRSGSPSLPVVLEPRWSREMGSCPRCPPVVLDLLMSQVGLSPSGFDQLLETTFSACWHASYVSQMLTPCPLSRAGGALHHNPRTDSETKFTPAGARDAHGG